MQDELKKMVALEALKYVKSKMIIGVGTGSTIKYFIDALATNSQRIEGVVSSSNDSSIKLKNLGISLFNLNNIDILDIYIDGADEINNKMQMIKGGGGALTKEKIIATMAKKFICIVDNSKQVDILGRFPLPVEIIPMARKLVSRELIKLGGLPKYRQGIITDNGNNILDVYNLKIIDAILLEEQINNIPGVVTVGLFAKRIADIVLIGTKEGVITKEIN